MKVRPEEMELALADVEVRPQKKAKNKQEAALLPHVYPPLRKVADALVNPEGHVITSSGEFLDEAESGYKNDVYYGCSYGPTDTGMLKAPKFGETIATDPGNVIVLTQVFKGAYYHTVAEMLPRLAHILSHNASLLDDSRIHLGCTKDWCKQWAVMFGLKSDNLMEGWVKAGTAIWPESNPCAKIDTTMARVARDSLTKKAYADIAVYPYTKPQPGTIGRAVVVDQKKVKHVDNIYDVIHATKMEGYQVTVHESDDLPSVMDMCRDFFCAEMIVGVESPLLANLICSRIGTAVIELHQHDPNPMYQYMTNKLQGSYHGIWAEIPHGGHANVTINKVKKQLGLVTHHGAIKKNHGELPNVCN